MYSRFYTPRIIYLGNVQSPFSSLSIDVGAQRAISAVFEMDSVDWNKSNVVLLCPIVRFFDFLAARPQRYAKASRVINFPSRKVVQKEREPNLGQKPACCQRLARIAASSLSKFGAQPIGSK